VGLSGIATVANPCFSMRQSFDAQLHKQYMCRSDDPTTYSRMLLQINYSRNYAGE